MMRPGTRLTFEWQDAQIEDWNSRPASIADLVDALREEGAEIQDTEYQRPAPWHHWVLLAPEKGRYLVYGPIPVEVEKETCPECGGRGTVREYNYPDYPYPDSLITESPCPECRFHDPADIGSIPVEVENER